MAVISLLGTPTLCAGLGYRQLSELQDLQDRLLRPAQRILRRYPGTAHGNADEVHHPQCWLGALVQCLGREYGASAAGAQVRALVQCAGLQLRHQEEPIDRRDRCDPVLLILRHRLRVEDE
jgi:hypothetical protein